MATWPEVWPRNHKRHIKSSDRWAGQSPLRASLRELAQAPARWHDHCESSLSMTAQEMTGKVKIVGGSALAIVVVWLCAL
ncbi:MAG: hypothetical protein J2P52_05935, partial [Blastocatellia bacterium]|nr:hypothetical protein [Blastocatellia bacterium]